MRSLRNTYILCNFQTTMWFEICSIVNPIPIEIRRLVTERSEIQSLEGRKREHCGISVGRCHFHFAHWRKVVRNFIALDFAPVIPPPAPTDRPPSNLHISRRRLVKGWYDTILSDFCVWHFFSSTFFIFHFILNEPYEVRIYPLPCRTPYTRTSGKRVQ